MGLFSSLLIGLLVLSSLTVIILVLVQHGKGADMGAAFGGGASGSLFGATGSANFLSRTTAIAATIFFLVTIGLAFTATNERKASNAPEEAQGVVPAASQIKTPNDLPDAPAAPEAPSSEVQSQTPTQAPLATDIPAPAADIPVPSTQGK